MCNPYDNSSSIVDDKIGVAMINLIRENQFAIVYFQFYITSSSTVTLRTIEIKVAFTSHININFYTLQKQIEKGITYYQEIRNQSFELDSKIDFRFATKIYGDDKSTLIGYASPVFAARNFNDESFILIAVFDKNVTDSDNIASLSGALLLVNP